MAARPLMIYNSQLKESFLNYVSALRQGESYEIRALGINHLEERSSYADSCMQVP